MPALPSFKVPSSTKSRGLSFGDLAPGLLGAGIGAARASGLFSGGPKFNPASAFTKDLGNISSQFLLPD